MVQASRRGNKTVLADSSHDTSSHVVLKVQAQHMGHPPPKDKGIHLGALVSALRGRY